MTGRTEQDQMHQRELIHPLYENYAIRLARSSQCPDLLREMADYRDVKVLAQVAMNRNTPSDVLDSLALHSDMWIRIKVGCHPSASPETLSKLSKRKLEEDSTNLLLAVACNPNTTPSDVARLIRDRSYQVQDAAARNTHAPYGAWVRKYRVLP